MEQFIGCLSADSQQLAKRLGFGSAIKSKEKLVDLYQRSTFTVANHEPIKIDVESFDWVSGHEERNWWWHIQSLPFLHYGFSQVRRTLAWLSNIVCADQEGSAL